MATIAIPIKGIIGKEITAKGVEALIKGNPEAKEIMLEVDSPGGEVLEGFSIYNLLKNSNKKIKASIVGKCASIATLIVSACKVKDIMMNSPVGMWLIHNPTAGLEGDAKELEQASDQLKTIESVMIDVYKERMGLKEAEIKELMNASKSFTPEEAKKAGLVGRTVEEIPVLKAVALFNPNALNKKDTSILTDMFETVKKMAEKMLAPDIKNALNLTLADGGIVYIDTEAETVVVGDVAFTDAEMTAHVAAGDYTLENGMLIVVGEAGAVTEIKEPQTEEAMKELQAQIKKLEAEMKKTAEENIKAKETETKYMALKKKVEDTAPPLAVDYSKMDHTNEGHFMDNDVKLFVKKYNNA